MSEYHFGPGNFFATPLNITTPTPIQFNALQGFDLDFKFENKMLYGQNQFPIAVARGKGSITGKMNHALISGAMASQLYFGITQSTGQLMTSVTEAAAVPANSPYTAQPANNTAYQADQGVSYASSGLPLTRVASAPTVGQYSLSIVSGAATYTFAAADAGAALLLNYTYTTTTTGNQATITSQAMGSGVNFSGVYTTQINGNRATIQLYSCLMNDFKLQAKQDDFMVPELSFSAFANAAGNIGILSFAN